MTTRNRRVANMGSSSLMAGKTLDLTTGITRVKFTISGSTLNQHLMQVPYV
jgi:hypothetical protein